MLRDEHKAWIKPRMTQLPLEIGDAVFFNPSCYHQPGVNQDDTFRTNGLFQVNSCMSKAMETKDCYKMTKAVWPVMKRWQAEIGPDANGDGDIKVCYG